MTISVGFHFTQIPTVSHTDFPKSDKPFTCAILMDDMDLQHHIYLPLGARLVVQQAICRLKEVTDE